MLSVFIIIKASTFLKKPHLFLYFRMGEVPVYLHQLSLASGLSCQFLSLYTTLEQHRTNIVVEPCIDVGMKLFPQCVSPVPLCQVLVVARVPYVSHRAYNIETVPHRRSQPWNCIVSTMICKIDGIGRTFCNCMPFLGFNLTHGNNFC